MRSRLVPIVSACALAGLALVLGACGSGDHSPTHSHDDGAAAIVESNGQEPVLAAGIVRTPAPEVGDLSLPNVADGGAPFAFRGPPDGVLLVFFGFTNCPDVCPTTMADLRAAIRRLPAADRDRVAVAFITVDPARDTGPVLTSYVRGFLPDGAALRTTDDAALRRVADAFSAAYEITEGADGEPQVNHTTFVYAVGPDGRIIVQWPFGTPTATIAADLQLALSAIASAAP